MAGFRVWSGMGATGGVGVRGGLRESFTIFFRFLCHKWYLGFWHKEFPNLWVSGRCRLGDGVGWGVRVTPRFLLSGCRFEV